MGPRRSLAHREPGEAADDDVLAGLGREVAAQLLDGLAVVLVGVDVDLVEQHDLAQPLLQLALADPRADVLGLGGGLLLEHAGLTVARILRDVVLGDPAGLRRRRDVQGHVLGEGDEVGVGGDEVGVAVDLDEHAHLAVGVDVALDGALAGLSVGELAELAAHLDAKDLDGLLRVPVRLFEGALGVHHPGAGLLAQGGDVLGADLLLCHAFCSWVSGAGSVWASASAVVVWLSASTSLAGGDAGSGVGSSAGGAGCATSACTSSVWASGVIAGSGCGTPASSRASAT